MSHSLKFPKSHRLRLSTLVDGLFAHGSSIYEFPLRLTWRAISPQQLHDSFRKGSPDGIAKTQMMITVPKKKRHKAVDRVLMRRRIREAYRLNRLPLEQTVADIPDIATLSLAFVFMHSDNIDYAKVQKSMIRILEKLRRKLQPSSESVIP